MTRTRSGQLVGTRASRRSGGFTLTEIFVVLLIAAVVVAISLPAFQSMMASSRKAGAENAVRVGVQVAQDASTREGLDSAAVFLQDEGGNSRIIVVVKVGEFEEIPGDPFGGGGSTGGGGATPGTLSGGSITREVFAPLPGASVIDLPEGYSVRGYVPAGAMRNRVDLAGVSPVWYDVDLYGEDDDTADAKLEGNWVAPLTSYYNTETPGGTSGGGNARTPRHSFMVRFQGGTGFLDASSAPVVVVDPRPSTTDANTIGINPSGSYQPTWWRVDRAETLYSWARNVVGRTSRDAWGTDPVNQMTPRSKLLGAFSNETVVAGPVTRLAVYKEEDLATDLGASGVNAITGTIFEPYSKNGMIALDTGGPKTSDINGNQRQYRRGVLVSREGEADEIRRHINAWIQGDTNNNGVIDPVADANAAAGASTAWGRRPDAPKSLVFVVDRLSGELREVNR